MKAFGLGAVGAAVLAGTMVAVPASAQTVKVGVIMSYSGFLAAAATTRRRPRSASAWRKSSSPAST